MTPADPTAALDPSARPSSASEQTSSRALLERFFWEWMWPRRRQSILVTVLTILLAAVSSTYPAIIKFASDALFGGNSAAVPYILAAIIATTVVKSTLLYHQTLASFRVVQQMSTEMQKFVFKRVMDADFARLTRDAPGHLMSKILTDISMVQNATQTIIGTAIRDVLTIVGYIASMIYLDWALSLVVLCIYHWQLGRSSRSAHICAKW